MHEIYFPPKPDDGPLRRWLEAMDANNAAILSEVPSADKRALAAYPRGCTTCLGRGALRLQCVIHTSALGEIGKCEKVVLCPECFGAGISKPLYDEWAADQNLSAQDRAAKL